MRKLAPIPSAKPAMMVAQALPGFAVIDEIFGKP
jgi:hypothetical protein